MSKTNNNRRTISTLALASIVALMVSSCAGSGQPPAPEPTGSGDISSDTSGDVRILMEEVPDTDIVQSLVDEFNEEYSDIAIEIESLPFSQLRDELVASFRAPDPTYDLVVVDNPWMVDFAQAGFLAPLDSRIDSTPNYDPDDFFEPLTDITSVDSQRYGVPFYNYALGYIYRTDLYEAAGLNAPTTLDELVSNSQTLTTPKHAGIAMQPQRGYKIFEEWANYLFAAGGSIYDENGKPSLDTPEANAALEAYIETYKSAAPEDSLSWAFDEAFRSVASGGAASMISYNWMLPTLNDSESPAGDLAGSFKLATIPGGKQVLGSWSWAIPANSSAPDAAWAFTSWITSKEVDAERVKAGGAVIRESTAEDPTVWSEGFGKDYYLTVAEILSNAAPLSQGEHGEEMIQAVGTELNAAVSGKKSVSQALKDAEEAMRQIQD